MCWALREESGRAAAGTEARTDWITRRLATLPAGEIADFQARIDDLHARSDTWDLWGAASVIFGGWCSNDGFWYFQLWLMGLGREAYEGAVTDPNSLAGVPGVLRLAGTARQDRGEEWPGWEELDYVADRAHFRDRVEVARRYPRLSALFPRDHRLAG